MIGIIDYGLGNVRAFINLYERINVATRIANDSKSLLDCSKLILPGVGSFDKAMSLLDNSDMRQTLDRLILKEHLPILGVCVGMQILARSSEEGQSAGLGYIGGVVKKIDAEAINGITKLPHMGWNSIYPVHNSELLSGIISGSRFYFLHSYHIVCDDDSDVISYTKYGSRFVSAICHGNIFGVQFHPEKSHGNGIKLLNNFALL